MIRKHGGQQQQAAAPKHSAALTPCAKCRRLGGTPVGEEKGKSGERIVVVFHSSYAYLYTFTWVKHSPYRLTVKSTFKKRRRKKNTTKEQRGGSEAASSVFGCSCLVARRKMKTWWSEMTFGQQAYEVSTRLCEDKGKACDGLQPSSSIWVLSSLGPGGTWEHTSHVGPAWIYCPLMAWNVQCCREAWLLVLIYERGGFHDRWMTNETK